jgi:UDP-N-acetyl-D-mannosaminuronate dehydrogenase
VIPGTTRSIAKKTGVPATYSPVRGKHVRMEEDLLHYAKFVSGVTDEATAQAEAHFEGAGMKTRRMGTVESLEVAKLAETTYFGVCIAFAQELNRYVERAGGNYGDAIGFFEEVSFLPRTRYFPGFIGGHCVIPNINLLLQVAPSGFLEAVLDSNERRVHELASESSPNSQTSVAAEKSNEPKVLADR